MLLSFQILDYKIFFKWPASAGRLPEWTRTRVDQKPEWIRTRVDWNCRISLCITRTIITHNPKWPVVRVFVCTSGPTIHRKCTSWIIAKEHAHLTSHATLLRNDPWRTLPVDCRATGANENPDYWPLGIVSDDGSCYAKANSTISIHSREGEGKVEFLSEKKRSSNET